MSSHQHDFIKIGESAGGFREICKICKFKLTTTKDPKTGRINNKEYLAHHLRSTAQPTGRTAKVFKKYYGDAPVDLRFK